MSESSVILIVFLRCELPKVAPLHQGTPHQLSSEAPWGRWFFVSLWLKLISGYNIRTGRLRNGNWYCLKIWALLYMCPPHLQCEETCVWWVPSKSGISARVLQYMKFLRFLWQTSMDIEICLKSPSFSTTFASPRASRLPALAERQEKTWMATRVKEPTLVGYKGLHPARSNAQKGWQNAGIS